MGLPCPPTGVGLSGGCEEGGPRTWLDKNEEAGSPVCLGDTFGRVTRDSEGRGGWVRRGLEAHGVGRRERGFWGRASLKSSSGVWGGGWGAWEKLGLGEDFGQCKPWRRVAPTLEPAWDFLTSHC